MPGSPLPIVPNALFWLEGMVTLCGALAPEAVEEMEEDCARALGIGKTPGDCGLCPG
jgi:hypothetical protein